MDCPRCSVEMVSLEDGATTISRCPECTGAWLDIADLNRMLLHHNLPGLETLGGRANPDEVSGTCPEDQVDLVVIEGGERRSLAYETCEVCGGIFLETGVEEDDVKALDEAIIDFYRRFGQPKGAAKGA